MEQLVWGNNNTDGRKNDGVLITKADSLFSQIDRTVQDSINNVAAWQTNQEKYHKMRMRIKKDKTFPFKNSSNLRMPTLDTAIKKVKAAVMNQVFGVYPIVQAVPTPSGSIQTAGKIEKFLTHLIVDIIGIKPSAEICIDQTLEKGMYLGKGYWRLQIEDRDEELSYDEFSNQEKVLFEQAAVEQIMAEIVKRYDVDLSPNVQEENLESIYAAVTKLKQQRGKVIIKIKDVIYNFPDVSFISPERVYVPTDSGFDVKKAASVTVEFFLPLDAVKYNVKYKGWSKEVIEEIEGLSNVKDLNIDTIKDLREGIERLNNPSRLVKVWETYGRYDIGNGKKELAVITSLPDFRQTVRKVRMTNLTMCYPLIKFFYEITDDRWFSHRGIPEILEDIIKEIDVQHNMKIDNQTLHNAPMLVYRAGMVNPRMARVNPAAGIPVQGLQSLDDTIKAINLYNPNTEYSYEREQMLLETKIQEFVGQVDFSLQSMINRRQPRTLGEVEQQSTTASGTFSLDASHFADSFAQLFQLVWELWCEYGPDEYEFNYFGQGKMPEPIKLTKEEIQGKYRIKIRGNDINSNPQIKLQKAQQIIMAATNPALIQMGVVNPQIAAEGLRRFYQALDIEDWEMLVPQNPQAPQPDPRTAVKPDFKELTDSEKAQVLNAFGVEADSPGRIKQQLREDLELSADVASKVGKDVQIGGNEPGQSEGGAF